MFDGPVTNLLSVQCILIRVLSGAHVTEEKKALMISSLALLIGRFPSDDAASMAVKVLIPWDYRRI